jgi:hypothetical protein
MFGAFLEDCSVVWLSRRYRGRWVRGTELQVGYLTANS